MDDLKVFLDDLEILLDDLEILLDDLEINTSGRPGASTSNTSHEH